MDKPAKGSDTGISLRLSAATGSLRDPGGASSDRQSAGLGPNYHGLHGETSDVRGRSGELRVHWALQGPGELDCSGGSPPLLGWQHDRHAIGPSTVS